MLVLTRKTTERIRIGDAWVTVMHSSRGRVKLGIEAPRETRVVLGELESRDKEAKQCRS